MYSSQMSIQRPVMLLFFETHRLAMLLRIKV
jgi:hypothetical protein